MTQRIKEKFQQLQEQKRCGLVTFFVANDPTEESFTQLLHSLPNAGVDIIEIGMPFSDPVADGVAIQAAGQRAIAHGTSLAGIFTTVEGFRQQDQSTPIVLMGYVNPVLHFGFEQFFQRCVASGVDGVILVDLPPEEEQPVRQLSVAAGVELIRLITPTTSEERLQQITRDCGGFLYFVSVSGITGTKSTNIDAVQSNIAMVRRHCQLPLAVGFGIKDIESAQATAQLADAIVIGSALVDYHHQQYQQGKRGKELVHAMTNRIQEFRQAIDSLPR